METIVEMGNKTYYHLDGELTLTIEKLGEGKFSTVNNFNTLVGEVRKVGENQYEVKLENNLKKDKLGRWRRDNSKIVEENTRWFLHILKEKGFIEK